MLQKKWAGPAATGTGLASRLSAGKFAMLGAAPTSGTCFCGGVGGRPGMTPICLTCARLSRVARVATERRLFWRWLQESSL